PTEYGFIEGTLAEDGDPLDVLVIVDEPTFPGCRIVCRAIGLFPMSDEKGPDDKILALPTWDRQRTWEDVIDVPDLFLAEISHFFDMYKDLEEGKHTKVGDWAGRLRAESVIDEARARHRAAAS
ncbi:MAG: inorganic diphosphatase, partial [Candidatus Dormibacteraeota bacterium]|nr:inorganic diphosphatase [Candidatus Dormibacteraeota bacterium]